MSGRPMPDNSADNPEGDSAPGYSHKRPAYEPDGLRVKRPTGPVVPYAELHCHSNFSFLDGVSDPEELIEEGVRLGLDALAITDHDGFYAASRFAEAALAYDLRTIYGAELSLGLTTPQNGVADPEGQHLLVLARGVEGYHRLAGAITEAQLRGMRRTSSYVEEELAAQSGGNWMILTGCRKGAVRHALITSGLTAAATELDRLTALFGHDHVVVELIDHGLPTDSDLNDALLTLAHDHKLPVVATNNVHFATLTAVVWQPRWLPYVPAGACRIWTAGCPDPVPICGQGRRWRRSSRAIPVSSRGLSRSPISVRSTCGWLSRGSQTECASGETPISWLRELTRQGADERYAHIREEAEERLRKELAVIEDKDFPGYFLIVHDMVKFARDKGILCQGRGQQRTQLSATCSASPQSIPSLSNCPSNASCRPLAMRARHRRRLRLRPA